MARTHGRCPNCGVSFDGDLIWQTFKDQGKSDEEADEIAYMYGATRTEGRWGKQLGIYSVEKDRTMAYKCYDCNYLWSV